MASNQERYRQQQLNHALVEAAEQGSLADIQSLLDRHADINAFDCYNSQTPLHYASQNGHHQCIEILLDRQAEANIQGYNNITPLHLASSIGNRQCIEILLDYGADKSLINVRVSLSQHMQASLS